MRFIETFAPATLGKQRPNRRALAFCVEGNWAPVAIEVRQEGQRLDGHYVGDAPPEVVASNLARILSTDIDSSSFAAVGERDATVRLLQERYAWLRPIGFWSPYAAAVWTIRGGSMPVSRGDAGARRGSVGLPTF